MESAGVDAITNSFAYATTHSTNACAAGRILHMSNSRCLSRTAREFCSHARSTPYDQLHAAHPHVHHTMCTMRTNFVDGCNANAHNLQTQHKNNFMPFKTILAELRKSWAQARRMVNGIITSNRKWQHA